jgi:tetratricopeptide (TPR) repeat protein
VADHDAAMDALAHAYYLQGAIDLRYANYERAVRVCQKSLSLYEQLENLPGAGAAHNNLANAYFDLGDWSNATDHYHRALQIAGQIGNVHESGLIANNLGEVYRYRGELDRARTHYEQSLQTWQTLGSLYGQAFLLMNLAAVDLKQAHWLSAIEQLERSQGLCAQIKAKDFSAEAYRYLAEAYLGYSQSSGTLRPDLQSKALDYAHQSVLLAERQEMKLEAGAARRVLGRIHLAIGDLRAAEEELSSSLDLLESLENKYQIGQTLIDQAILYRELGQLRPFRQNTKRAIDIFEHLGARLDLKRARQLG